MENMQSSLIQTRMTVVQPNGHINAENAAVLKQQLAETVSSHEYNSLLIDMSQVESLDSAGLMVFVSTLTLAQRLGKSFGLFGISPAVRIIFELTQLDRVFHILDSHPGVDVAVA
jgi:anti-sigma B factor antagonist